MTAQPTGTPPPALAHNVRYNKVLHGHVVILTVSTAQRPYVAAEDRIAVESLGHDLYNVRVQYGFMEDPDVPDALLQARQHGLVLNLEDVVYFLGRETIIVTRRKGMAIWREHLFVVMARNAVRATAFFRLPPERVVELGVKSKCKGPADSASLHVVRPVRGATALTSSVTMTACTSVRWRRRR